MNNFFSELEHKTVIVTGGSKGIGKDIALTFAKLKANVVISGRDNQVLEETLKELKNYNNRCMAVQGDLSIIENIKNLIETTAKEFGTIDILINNAGVNIAKPALEVTEADWDTVLDLNLKSVFFTSQAAAKYMSKQKNGKIINIASQMAFVGYYNRAAYCSSKGGLVQLTKALAVEWAKLGINVNAVAPTFIETELTAKMFEDEAFKKDVENRILLKGLSQPKDISGAVLYLASDLANFVTGETLKVDGGWTAI
ncbi:MULTISPECIES: SDR family NAD(P)-dependent oxidoreductase [Psychrobacillus]|uniref:3-oxoacyl-ACP reductase FabG n=1 Tax=Psychrobacillus faecigallinarum TaxID=2762235 RepID=A0ABR8R8M4_9BACI|nr:MULTISPECIES: 3-oxoacyl-ACP reductase family protein [Psychrobacillus]MBD7944156.1 3-oxoacyl-ACP reductase FabG [Psychrobacillus faecigallinarum]QEY21025.1 3-oxoacyl-ACP reductase FabG [Psychrobacillus sp. AK 1817]QGM31533.1 glucose 1-dehydrogenase [Bacillus sp. N3536]